MSQQYFTSNPTSESRPEQFEAWLLDQKLSFHTDSGVFSRDAVDYGTRVLLSSLPPLSGRVLDLGCGWGAIGVTIGKKYPGHVVEVTYNGETLEISGSILALISLGLVCGAQATLNITGPDEEEAIREIGDLFEYEFDFPPR